MINLYKKQILAIREQLYDIETMGPNVTYDEFLKDAKLRKAIEWSIVSAIEGCINLGRQVIAEKDLRIPENNREVFEILSEEGLISEELLDKMKRAIGYRNMAIHRYSDLDPATTFGIMKKRHFDLELFLSELVNKL